MNNGSENSSGESEVWEIGKYSVRLYPSIYNDPSRMGLSKRELEALYHLAKGNSKSEVSLLMGVSENTIDTFKRRIFEKLGVKSVVQAAVIAIAIACGGDVEIQK